MEDTAEILLIKTERFCCLQTGKVSNSVQLTTWQKTLFWTGRLSKRNRTHPSLLFNFPIQTEMSKHPKIQNQLCDYVTLNGVFALFQQT